MLYDRAASNNNDQYLARKKKIRKNVKRILSEFYISR